MPRRAAAQGARNGSAANTNDTRGRAAKKDEAEEPTGMTSEDDTSGDDSGSDFGDESGSEAEFKPDSADEAAEEEPETDVESDDSDALDDKPVRKRKSAGSTPQRGKKARTSLKADDDLDDDIELEEGQVVAGRIHPAPKTGLVPPGQISQNTLDFLDALLYPENNNREWFKSHEPAFRMAEKEYRDFVDQLQVQLNEVDEQLPILPARDICHRIYRDTRFSSDKTPYKCNFGMTYSRSGRKGIWAGYHLYVSPGDRTVLACGAWQPWKEELARIRERIIANPEPLRHVISRPEFVKLFGKAEAHPKGKRQNIFGHSDQLKVAPKGVDKTHPQIDLLKLRTFSVARYFTDSQVTDPNFIQMVKSTVAVMAPFVHTLNRYISPDDFDGHDSD